MSKPVTSYYEGIASSATSVVSDWVTFIEPTGIDDQDQSGTVTDPGSLGATRLVLKREQTQGTFLQVRLAYDPTLASIVSPVIKVFGRCSQSATGGTGGDWQILQNRSGSSSATLTTAAEDTVLTIGGVSLEATTASMTTHTFDCAGCDEFVCGVETALSGITGSAATAVVQAKFF